MMTTGSRAWKLGVGIALILAAAAFALAFLRANAAAADVRAAREARLFESKPQTPIEQLALQVRRAPMQPDLLHGLIAARVAQRRAERLSVAERKALESLGWQSSIIQFGLIQDGLKRLDVDVVLKRIDGMLRRGKQTPTLVALLVQLERSGPEARAELVKMLSAKPSWRRDFLLSEAGMTGRKALLARASTLDSLFARKLAPRREEVAPIVNGLDAIGEAALAERLWRQFGRIGRVAAVPHDSRFVGLAANQADGQVQTIVYEWRAFQGSGYSARAAPVGDGNATLTIRWDGRGAPVFLSQRLVTQPGRFAIAVKGMLLGRSDLQSLAFVAYCQGRSPIFHDRLTQGLDGAFVYGADEPVTCPNPELRLVGLSDGDLEPLEIELMSIRIARLDEPKSQELPASDVAAE